MTKKEKLELYYRAKDAYYNGEEIMTDLEFDTLEKELGLENKSVVGAKNPSYTVKHPFIMGSISKVQIHKNKEGNIDWNKYYNEMLKYTEKQCNYIITPKYDGCSFEVYVNNGQITISSRGDGNFGKDLKKHLYSKIPNYFYELSGTYTLRGEVLVHKSVFEKEYAEQFTNPRSFVSGVLNRDYNKDDLEFMSMLNDLCVIIYDFRTFDNGNWTDRDWTELCLDEDGNEILSNDIRCVLPDYYKIYPIYKDKDHLAYIYEEYSQFRKECTFALDGIVIKPVAEERINNTTERRPKDCVAIKFIPMLEETEVLNITWNLGKTSEYTPIIWVRPVEMDGRMVQKCSGHNLGYLREKGVTIGAKVIMSLAGDIIPFLYKVTQPNETGEIPMPTDHEYYEDDIHLMAALTEKDKCYYKFINSVSALNIPNIGPATAKEIFKYVTATDSLTEEFFGEEQQPIPFNILQLSPEAVYFGAGGSKAGKNAQDSFKKILDNLSLNDIIQSCNFKFCGPKVTEQVVNYLLTGDADFTHLATEGYSWVYDKNSEQYNEMMQILEYLAKDIEDFKVKHVEKKKETSSQIPIIMTGEPNNYATKQEFLNCHQEYRNTTSWKEVQIVFTNSLESNTGKMKKAREKNIKIELY